MNFFKKFYTPPVGTLETSNSSDLQVDCNEKNEFKRTFLSPDIFTDPSSAKDYVCKICHFMAVDPLEHVPEPDVKCSNIFCLPCVETYCASGLSSCPAEGCLTNGFKASSLRELGIREISRLSNLTLNCEFNCKQVITYGDYWNHQDKCPANPANFCELCDSPKIDDAHNCRDTFLQMKQTSDNLMKENAQLKIEIDLIRREMDALRIEKAEKLKNGTSIGADEIVGGGKCSSSTDIRDVGDINTSTSYNGIVLDDLKNKKNPRRPRFGSRDRSNKGGGIEKRNGYHDSLDYKPQPSTSTINDPDDTKESGFLRGSLPQYKFHSNWLKYSHSSSDQRIRLVFHYAEKSFTLNDVASTFTFRTLRSLLTDMMKFDPGIMMLVQHRTFSDKDTIEGCRFKSQSNSVSLVPFDTPDFNEAGYRLSLYRCKDASDPLNARGIPPEKQIKAGDSSIKNKEAVDFYSNCIQSKSIERNCDLTLNFRSNGKQYSMEVKKDQTIGAIRSMVEIIIKKSPGKMMYITHLLIRDDMTVKQCGITSGIADITLLPSNFPVKLEEAPILHMIRFRGGKLAKKTPGQLKSRTNSMASLI